MEPLILIALVKTGWTDEARAAAAEARRHSYTSTASWEGDKGNYAHDEGHKLTIEPSGAWQHKMPSAGDPRSLDPKDNLTEVASGGGPKSLKSHLDQVHGPVSPVGFRSASERSQSVMPDPTVRRRAMA